MSFLPPKKLRRGDYLTAAWLNQIRSLVLRNRISLGVNSGLVMSESDGGKVLRTASSGATGQQLAYTNGTITARSGTTPGAGTVYLVRYDGSVFQIMNGSGGNPTITQAVKSYSSTTGGIATGNYVWIAQNPADLYWYVISVDCG